MILKVWNFFEQPFWSLCGVISRKLLIKSRNQNIFQKFKLNQNLRRIPFKMMYSISMLRHRFSNERWGGGGGDALSHLPLLFCKSVYFLDNPGINNVNLLPVLLKSARRSSWRSLNAQQFTKRDFKAFFNSHFSFIKVDSLQGHESILLAFHKHMDASSAEILAALQILLFSVIVKLLSYTSAASAKDLLDFHSPLFLKFWRYIWQVTFFKICQNVIQFKFNQLTARLCLQIESEEKPRLLHALKPCSSMHPCSDY